MQSDARDGGERQSLRDPEVGAGTATARPDTALIPELPTGPLHDPLSPALPTSGPGRDEPVRSPREKSVKRLLLVVEDNPGDARLLREMFNDQDANQTQVTHVESMSEAEEHLAAHAVDVILLDLGLPDARGLEAVQRTQAAAPRVPLVVLTGLDDEALAVQALQQGAQDYLIKGQIEGRGLLRALRYAIERKSLEDARKAAENQLLQAQKLESVGRLAGGIAHDFNNMLFAISGYAELLGEDLASVDPAAWDRPALLTSVHAISHAADRATSLTAQLLAFSRQQSVTLHVHDLNSSVTRIEPMVRQLIGKHMRLIIHLDPEAGYIRADGGQIDQILVNLVVNARDAMPEGGTVTIESGNAAFVDSAATRLIDVTPGSYVFLAVSDTGMGMDRATRDHMFEPFFTTKEVGKGTGLGLATIYGIVNQAGGHIHVESEPGNGSAFKLYFPRVDEGIDERHLIPLLPTVGAGRILVVEDEPAVRDIVARLLERAGYVVLSAADGIEALEMAGQSPPIDVLVTDVIMPNGSGIDLAEQMMDTYPHIGVVLLSGYTAETLDVDRVLGRGARFVSKPVTQSQLLQAVLQAGAVRLAGPAPA